MTARCGRRPIARRLFPRVRAAAVWYPWLADKHWLCVGPDGHYRGSKDVESQAVCVAILEDGRQHAFTPKAFPDTVGWTNDPARARLMTLDPW